MGDENFDSVGECRPEVLKTVIHYVFKRVTVILVQCHPRSFFGIVDRKVCRGNKSVGESAEGQNPTKLDAEDQEETVHMAGKVFMRLDEAFVKHCIVRWKIGFAPLSMMVIIVVVCSAAGAAADSTTISLSVVLVVRHVAATSSKTGEVDAGATSGDNKGAWVVVPMVSERHRSAQIRDAVSVHQGSLIRKACRYFWWACMMVVCCCEDCAGCTV